jgi:uncharacterized protein involved in exopolysaccharide biosynthesis
MTDELKNIDQTTIEDDEINLLDLWRVVWGHRKMISRIVLITVVATAVVSLIMTNIYQSKAIIAPVTPKSSTTGASSLAQQLGPLAGMAGVSLASPGSTVVPLPELVSLLKSNIVRGKMIQKYNLLPILFEDRWDAEKKDWKRGGLILNPLVWIRKAVGALLPADPHAPKKKDDDVPDIQDGLRKLEEIVTVKENIKENTIGITVDYPDPELSAIMANYLLETLNDHLTGEAKRVAKINKDYLEDQLAKNSDLFIRQKIYNLIADQVEMMTMTEVKENFAFKVLDPPMVPDQKSKPKRTLMVILSLFVSLFVGVFLAFFKEYLEKNNIQLEVSWPKWLWRQSK